MIRLLQLLIFGHIHEWEIYREEEYFWPNDFDESGFCFRYTLRCKKCGAMKTYKAR